VAKPVRSIRFAQHRFFRSSRAATTLCRTVPIIALAVIAALAAGYVFYSRFLVRLYNLDDARPTPAVTREDGVDYVPTPRFYLLGQHFSAIAAAGPIAGPILACITFGWAPCLVWILLGVIFIGAVHDFSSLVASVRHGGASVAEVVRENVGKPAWIAILAFIWLALIYVLVAFADITANTFVGKTQELEGVAFNPGGAVAAASAMYLALSVIMGLVQRKLNPPLWLLTVIFVPATLLVVWLGTRVSTVLVFDARAWGAIILVYCFIAALLPMWVLLQPRGYLGGFVLYMVLGVGVLGVFFGGLPIAQPAFKGWSGPKLTDSLFPFLFVTIACGACSGFHGLVCSGTTSKQIAKETHCRSVGYGGMLLEAFVAVIALATVMFVPAEGIQGRGPGKLYGDGIGQFLTLLIGDDKRMFATTFGAMAFSTFIFDTIDVATRLGRYILQELFRASNRAATILATLLTVAVPALLLLPAAPPAPGQPPTYMLFWTLFGTSNQLLAALTLMGISVWLHRLGKRYWYTLVPMLFVLTITLWALVLQIQAALKQPLGLNAPTMNAVVGTLLLCLAVYLGIQSVQSVRRRAQAAPAPA
jgi:carbon starvation protein